MTTTNFQLKNGRVITLLLEIDEEWREAQVTFYENGKKLDNEFVFIDEYDTQERYLLKRMYCPVGLTRQGLGEAALRLFKSFTHANIWTREPHEQDLNDGSHLTGGAIPFIRKMQHQDKGLIEWWQSDIDALPDDYS